MVRHQSRSDKAERYGTRHVDLAGPCEIQSERRHGSLLIMAHRVQRGTQSMLASGQPTRFQLWDHAWGTF
eukprot:2677202-Prorocentrum_lima.AAC.1